MRTRQDFLQRKAEFQRLETLFGPLDGVMKSRIKTYAREVLGAEKHWRELASYTLIAGEFREGWIPDTYMRKHVLPKTAGALRQFSKLKSMTRRLLPDAPLPDIGYFANDVFLNRDFRVLSTGQLERTLFKECDKIIFKGDASFGAKSILVLDRAGFDPDAVRNYKSGVFQRFVSQHADLAAVSPGPVVSLRVITWCGEDGKVVPCGSTLRMGRKTQGYVGEGERFVSSVDIATGCLRGPAYDGDWRKFEAHPDTGVVFDGHQLPKFFDAVEVARHLHGMFPYVRLIGWDLVIEEDESVAVLEWNFFPGVEVTEALAGPCFLGLGWEDYWRG